jgi:hypothetical protein
MRKAISLTASFLLLTALSGCAAGMAPVTGFVYSEVSGPLAVTNASASSRTGTSQCKSILGWIALGDCSIQAAKQNGNITTVSSVDYKTKSILGLYAEVTTTVKGQ